MEQYVEAGDCRIRYELEGAAGAPALLLINSIGATTDLWARQAPALSASHRVIRYDARGHGGSGVPGGEYTMERLGLDALAVLDAAGAPAAHVCGISLGGITAMWLGVHAPERVTSLVVANTAPRIGSLQSWNERMALVREHGMAAVAEQAMPRWFTERFRERDPERVDALRTMLQSCPPVGYLGCCAALRDADLRDDISAIRAPVLAIAGASDVLTPPSAAEYVRDTVPGARLVTLDCAHLSNVELPDEFTTAVLDHVRRAQ